jgi:hypothetical protein
VLPSVRATDEGGAAVLVGLARANAELGDRAGANAALDRAIAEAKTPAMRERIEKTRRDIAKPAVAPVDTGGTGSEAGGATGAGATGAGTAAETAKRPPWMWIGIGAGAVVLAGIAVTLGIVLGQQAPRADTDLGWFPATF